MSFNSLETSLRSTRFNAKKMQDNAKVEIIVFLDSSWRSHDACLEGGVLRGMTPSLYGIV